MSHISKGKTSLCLLPCLLPWDLFPGSQSLCMSGCSWTGDVIPCDHSQALYPHSPFLSYHGTNVIILLVKVCQALWWQQIILKSITWEGYQKPSNPHHTHVCYLNNLPPPDRKLEPGSFLQTGMLHPISLDNCYEYTSPC